LLRQFSLFFPFIISSGKLRNGTDVKVKAGDIFTFHNDNTRLGDNTQVSTSYEALARSVKKGDTILVDDGLLGFTVLEKNLASNEVICRCENDGILGETKGVNLPGINVELPAITEKDAADIEFGVRSGVDFIAASFIRKASDVLEIRELIKGTNIKIISKIENQEGLNNFDEILAVSDGIMVARGDLGVEVPVEQGYYLTNLFILHFIFPPLGFFLPPSSNVIFILIVFIVVGYLIGY